MERLSLFLTVVLHLIIIAVSAGHGHGSSNHDDHDRAVSFYKHTCPKARRLARQTVKAAIEKDKGLPAALLRLSFHDCFVRGCDASITIDSTANNTAEKDGIPNFNSVRGYEVIDAVKAKVEKVCPGVVSCADIIALAGRDAIVAIGGPSWNIVSGRRDGLVSSAIETLSELPPPFGDHNTLLQFFAKKGLDEREMVVLSGSHTIGVARCGVFQNRLYNGTGPNGVDPSLDSAYAAQLKTQCRFNVDAGKAVFMDPSNGGNKFDSNYFTDVLNNKGLFTSDAQLLATSTGRFFVQTQASTPKRPFFRDFSRAMEKMVNIELKRAPEGQIRKNCRIVNSA